MNKSFKVVFNKARGALMVVNEVTSSVQAKGTKTVIAAAVAALAAGVAGATEIPEIPEGVKADTVEVTDWKDIDSEVCKILCLSGPGRGREKSLPLVL